MLIKISFPPLVPYGGGENLEGPPGTAFQVVD